MTAPETNRILVVDDEPFIRKLAERELALPGREVTTAATAAQALRLAKRNGFDVVLLDVRLPDGNGNRLLEHFRETLPDVEVIMITGYSEVDSAVEAMKAGAYDYVTKPFSLDRMNLLIDRAYQRRLMQRELRMNKGGKARATLIGTSAPMRQIGFLVDKVALTDAPVLITGESGVGKNVVVNVLHSRSSRAEMPLIVKNCGAFNKELLRSELFGYCKGAFTGAETSQEGVLAQADKGTLFFDEVGELPLEVQAMLLRVFESQTYRRVGDREERSVDVRFLFATNRDLAREVEEGRFHEALYHRLNVFRIDIPPLRERKEDIPQLIEHFLQNLYPDRPPYRLSKRAGQSMIAYDWPGNVRELRNVIERGIILAENDLITTKCLPSDIADSLEQGEPLAALPTLEQQEKRYILRVMEHVDQNRTQAARILGIGRKTLYRKLRSFEES
ncbi:sigma-54 dependent transcriptional regulator [Pseudodesulfovibrio thermohalotolerans]|uniref:sigma-54-dependent transcriptional regulator n=1 Tax=Pseudodesulfovibrio thermohalotolerans TaxID=2880651 RepID=UPI00244273AD|nr:sigma-54 dependent transcriptional regulator [Pseudodesulfovibrio thermohalotolerans]WFS62646.1 sigma-54 dependent transcriptional regulator [Pseudodesulfovibrio thermohalotolerans]